MRIAVVAGIVLGLLVEGWTFVMGATGWYKDPARVNLFFLVVLIEVVVLVLMLRRSAAENGYRRQVTLGFVASLVASVIIVPGSLLFTTVAYPRYFDEIREMQEGLLRQAGKSAEEIRTTIEAAAATQTPAMQALAGAVGTLLTGLAVSIVAGAFLRKKE